MTTWLDAPERKGWHWYLECGAEYPEMVVTVPAKNEKGELCWCIMKPFGPVGLSSTEGLHGKWCAAEYPQPFPDEAELANNRQAALARLCEPALMFKEFGELSEREMKIAVSAIRYAVRNMSK